MKRKMWLVAVPLALAALAVVAVYAQEPAPPAGGVLAGLRVGQNIAMTDAGAAVQLTVFAVERPGPFKVTEVGADYVVIQDLAGLNEHRIPLTSIKALTHVKR
ncbi:MAG TPA: hypothetical protein VNE39_26055 [Planctomycetota bacterium]|nr:hypothetical protein [Planctomycetota bacterium]